VRNFFIIFLKKCLRGRINEVYIKNVIRGRSDKKKGGYCRMDNNKKPVIRLNTKELLKAAIDHDIKSDMQLAALLGVSATQIWRAKLKTDHPQYNAPGPSFIAGVLSAFGGTFEQFFFLEQSDTRSQQK
jgi:hypothetical protein